MCGFTMNEEITNVCHDIRYYCSVLSRRITKIDRRNIAKVRDFTIIIDEDGIINAVIAVEHIYAVM